MHRNLAFALLLVTAHPLVAEVVDSSPHGFTSRNATSVTASAQESYAKLVHSVGVWWNEDHTFSGFAFNLSIEAEAGGCFCETLPNGGSIRHMEVVHANPGRMLRMSGGLGPLQATSASGTMTWEIAEVEAGSEITVTYCVAGYLPQGLDSWAPAVDRVVGEQLGRLAAFINTGFPDQPKAAATGEASQ